MNENQVLYINSICDNIIFSQYNLFTKSMIKDITKKISQIKANINTKGYSIYHIEKDITNLNSMSSEIRYLRLAEVLKDDLQFCINEIKEFLEAYLVLLSI